MRKRLQLHERRSIQVAVRTDTEVRGGLIDSSSTAEESSQLLSDQRRALPAAGLFAFRDVSASMDANDRWCGN